MNSDTSLLPLPDELGIPGPSSLFLFLYLLTFVIHTALANFVIGGSAFLALQEYRSLKGNETAKALSRRILQILPVVFSLTITFGVAPLLFVQVLYGQFFYSANVLLGGWWLLNLGFILSAFYIVYWLATRSDKGIPPSGRSLAGSIILSLFTLKIALLFTSNSTLSIEPDRWQDVALQHGMLGAINSPILIPRYFHNIFGAMIMSGIWIAWAAATQRTADSAIREQGIRAGVRWSLFFVLLQVPVGLWYLMQLQEEVRSELLGFGSPASILWYGGLMLVVVMIYLMAELYRSPDSRKLLYGVTGVSLAILVGMVAAREHVRQGYLKPYFSLGDWTVNLQPGPMVIFGVTLVVGLVVIGVILNWLRTGENAAD